MHILHINDSLERGGAETLLVNTVQALAQLHPEVKQTVVTLYDKGELKEGILKDADYYSLGFKKTNPFPAIQKLREIIKDNKVQVVHSHLLHATFLARIALPKSVGLVSTYHSVFYEPTMVTYARVEKYIDKFTYRDKYYSLFVSQAVKENIAPAIGIHQNQKVLLNFASANFKPSYFFKPDKELRIVMVGNLHEIKNHEIAIKALGELGDLPVSLDIYGEGNLRGYLEKMIADRGANVNLKGKAQMSSEILSRYDLYAMTSLHEGMPLSLLEALQTGMPSLLNDVAMLKETAADGAIYYAYNSLDSLVDKIRFIFNNKVLLQDLSQKALYKAKNYSGNTYIAQLMQIYKNLIR